MAGEYNSLSNNIRIIYLFQSCFGIPYANCGCSLPGEAIGRKLFTRKPPQTHLVYSDYDGAVATHPSDHDSVYPLHCTGINEDGRNGRRLKAAKRRKRDLDKVQAGKFDMTVYARGEGHDPAFLTPIPLYWTDSSAACTIFYGAITEDE